MRPWENQGFFLNNGSVFNVFGALLCIFKPYLQQILQSLGL